MNRNYRKAYWTTILLIAVGPAVGFILLFLLGQVLKCF